jgi:oxygen-independent coproporphyrinogen-3 oxidase
MAETMLLGLRLSEGIGKLDFARRFGRLPDDAYGPILSELRDGSLISEDKDRIRLTYRGRMVGNEIFCRFLPASDRRSD